MGSGGNTKLRDWSLNLALFAAAGLASALVFEGLARALIKVPAPVLLRDGLYVSGLPLINGHPSCRWVPTAAGAPLPLVRRPGELRVFVFGESSVQGSPWDYAGSPATMLGDRLSGLLPGRPVTVVNMGRSCASMMDSYYYLLSAAPYRPDIVVFYQGSNDRFDADRERCLPASRPALHATWRFLAARSRLLWAARALAPRALRSWENRALGEPAPPRKPGCDPNEAFAAWTRILIGAAKELGAGVIVTTPVRNPLLPMELQAWSPKPSSVRETIKGLEPRYRELLRCALTPGCVPARGGPLAAPEAEIEGRAEAWKASAAAGGARFVDFRPRLSLSAPRGEGAGWFFVGETHLTLEGYGLLSSLWAGEIVGLLGGGEPGGVEPGPASVRRYADVLEKRGEPVGLTFYSEGLSYLRARMLLLAVPSLRQAAARNVADAHLVLAGLRKEVGLPPALPDGLKARWARFDLDGHLKRLPARGDAPPPRTSEDLAAALAYYAAGDLPKTEAALARVLARDPADATGLLLRGSVFLQTGRLDEALGDFDALIERAPGGPEVLADALIHRGQTFERLGRRADAARDYARCLDVAPRGWKRRAAAEELLRALRAS